MKRSSAPVLVVEDDHFLSNMIVQTLNANNVTTSVAHDGKEAMACMEKVPPSLVILDLLLPGVDGFAVMERMQHDRDTTPIIVLTNLSDAANRKRCKDAGCKAFLVKSDLDADNLWPTLSKYL